MGYLFYTTMVLFIIVCIIMMLLILIQKGRGGGLASAFGGAGGHTAFGAKTGDVLTWATSIVFGVFLLLAIVLNLVAHRTHARATGAPMSIPGQPAQQTTDGGEQTVPTPVEPLPNQPVENDQPAGNP